MINWIKPDWIVAQNVRSLFTTRTGGVSVGKHAGLNLAQHVDDRSSNVEENRRLVLDTLPGQPCWLEQVHSIRCLDVDTGADDRQADASITQTPGQVLAVMTADCLPILLANETGECVAVIHAGWRGLAEGIIQSTLESRMDNEWVAWLGPAIGPCHYQVGSDVRDRFQSDVGFIREKSDSHNADKWLMDLYLIARMQLAALGVTNIFGGKDCTFCDRDRFYSYRRDGLTGRMAGFIWLE